MKKIDAIIKPFKLEEVKDALEAIGVSGITATEVRGFGRQMGQVVYQGWDNTVRFLPKIRVELVVEDDLAERACEAIIKAARTGKIGDGKIFVSSVEKAVRIRTGELDERAEPCPEPVFMTACILIVEDQAIIARGLQRELEKLGHEVIGLAYTSAEALNAAADLNPDVILMDIGLENGVDGIAVASVIRKERDVPVIFMTGFSDPDTLERAVSVSPFGHIMKPFEIRDIQAAITAALCKHGQTTPSRRGSRAKTKDPMPAAAA